MFLSAAQRFIDQGRLAGHHRRVLSLRDPNLELENPFPGVPEWPKSFPLIRNHDLRRSIDEWLMQHGLPGENDNAEEEEKEIVHSRRDGDGFQNGIFYGDPNERPDNFVQHPISDADIAAVIAQNAPLNFGYDHNRPADSSAIAAAIRQSGPLNFGNDYNRPADSSLIADR